MRRRGEDAERRRRRKCGRWTLHGMICGGLVEEGVGEGEEEEEDGPPHVAVCLSVVLTGP